MKKLLLFIILSLAFSPLLQAQWSTDASGNMANTNSGNVGVNLLSATSKFVITQNTYLGTTAQNNLLASSFKAFIK
ncbi:hypothetical protein ACCC92_09610 [Mucilaginibacter sp. Mucisp84]|uniref:hypothetical protein n=1 Tax=Mucilaginibacter sp. Mucisp84 TaxID=3243058 RepID=UPI0039A729E2